MRKHLFGFAIFISIVTAAVLVYGYFNSPPIPVIPVVDNSSDLAEISRSNGLDGLEYQITSSEFWARDGLFLAVIELRWSGTLPPPNSFFLNFHLTNFNGKRDVSVSRKVFLEEMFANGNRSRVNIRLDNLHPSFAAQDNIYTFIEFSEDGRFRLLPEHLVSLRQLTPVLRGYN